MLSAGLVATLFAGTALAQGLPEFFSPQVNTTINLGTVITGAMPIWTINGTKYTLVTSFDGSTKQASAEYWAWAKKHHIKLFADRPALYVNLAAFVKAFYHPFHPIYDGPNLAPPLPKGVTMAQWKAAVVQAKEAASAYRTVSFAQTNEPWQYSPLATKTQWFNDPSDPFYNKSFPVKDLKDGFVLNRKPLVIVQRTKGHAGIFVTQYVGGGTNGTYWEGEMLNAKGQVVQIATGLGASPNDEASYLHPYTNLGEKINTSSAPPSVIWGAGAGTDVVPLPKWNPLWVLSLQNA